MYRESLYRSTLIVTGPLPGVYQYSVTNRATHTMVNDSFNIGKLVITIYFATLVLLDINDWHCRLATINIDIKIIVVRNEIMLP